MSPIDRPTSWLERTILMCDQILVKAAGAHPSNSTLRKLAPENFGTIPPDPRESTGRRKALAS